MQVVKNMLELLKDLKIKQTVLNEQIDANTGVKRGKVSKFSR